MTSIQLFDRERPDIVIQAREAQSPWEAARGLIGSPQPGEASGLLLKTKQVHTFGMSYPIDALYLDPGGKVLKVKTLQRARMGPVVFAARWVLELAAGEAARLSIAEGTHLVRSEPA